MRNALFIDCSLAGISGDMAIAALLGLSSDPHDLLNQINKLFEGKFNKSIQISILETEYNDFKGYKLKIDDEVPLSINELRDLISSYTDILDEPYLKIAIQAFDILVASETKIHGSDPHLHELGTSDTVIDIISTSFILQSLDISQIGNSAVMVGSGTVKTEHGVLPVPAPVSLEIMKEYEIEESQGKLEGEASTPTGLALLASMKSNLERLQGTTWSSVSLGFGNKTWPDRGNFLRVRLGVQNHGEDRISILETNLDDISGEHMGNIVDTLMEKGAVDVSYFPIFMKKNRPGYCLRVITTESKENQISDDIMKYTGTLGIRVSHFDRHIGSRKVAVYKVSIELNGESISLEVPVKIGPYRKKIEFEFLKELSNKYNLSPLQLESKIWIQLNKLGEF